MAPAARPASPAASPSAKRQARARGAAIAAWGIDAVKLARAAPARGRLVPRGRGRFPPLGGLGSGLHPAALAGLRHDRPLLRSHTALGHRDHAGGRGSSRRRRWQGPRTAEPDRCGTDHQVQSGPPGSIRPLRYPHGREVILVPGQVADDWAVLIGRPPGFAGASNINATLLERVRAAHPEAFVIFKPHPDVEHLGRAGALDEPATFVTCGSRRPP